MDSYAVATHVVGTLDDADLDELIEAIATLLLAAVAQESATHG